ncbi:MAG TPA: SDR family NAD(P)-dependent oxidoreductase [Planctomycetota bacterium]|nr:SDR family NAD(P)-dependent oxidoreductase [Planctomycetota bacterium]
MRTFDGRVAVITGAASGIGRAIARRCAAEGMRLVLADVEEPALQAAARELADEGARVLALPVDVADREQVQALAAQSFEAFGAVHLVCNNAGVALDGPIWRATQADWRWLLGVNLWGVVHGIEAFVPRMLETGEEGHVVNTASIAGLISGSGLGVYKATKHAVVSISETLDAELRELGSKLRASVLCPGFVRTRIADSGRNRPGAAERAQPADAPRGEAGDAMQRAVDAGSHPDEVAAALFDAVREERFGVLTHSEWLPQVRERFEGLLGERNPGGQRQIASLSAPGPETPQGYAKRG